MCEFHVASECRVELQRFVRNGRVQRAVSHDAAERPGSRLQLYRQHQCDSRAPFIMPHGSIRVRASAIRSADSSDDSTDDTETMSLQCLEEDLKRWFQQSLQPSVPAVLAMQGGVDVGTLLYQVAQEEVAPTDKTHVARCASLSG